MSDGNDAIPPSDFYREYSTHKNWRGKPADDGVDRFSSSLRELQLPQAAHILELGFGEGRFLDWARGKGHSVEGTEILPEMVERARARGHMAHLGTLDQLDLTGKRFDLMVAFDVVEHLSIPELLDLFETANKIMTPDGKLLFQFPNASSPFSAFYQAGDITHKSALGWEALKQLSETKGWTVIRFFNARPDRKNPLKALRWWAAHRFRDLIEVIVGYVYYGLRLPMDPNIVVVLARSKSE